MCIWRECERWGSVYLRGGVYLRREMCIWRECECWGSVYLRKEFEPGKGSVYLGGIVYPGRGLCTWERVCT